MPNARAVELGKLRVGGDAPALFLPDIDVYFKRDVGLALALLDRLKAAGAPAVKGALIHDRDMCFDGPVEASYYRPGHGVVRERYRDVLDRHVLPLADAATIYRRAAELGLEIVLTVYDVEGADFALGIGAAALKVASSNITHAPLIRHMARCGKPLIVDTGRSSLDEIRRAVQWAREAGAGDLIVQHSPPAPPAPVAEHHLRMMATLGAMFDCPFGLSDHHIGNEMMVAAVALGASVVEKGICADDAPNDIDIAHAARIGEVAAILGQLDNAWRALGEPLRPEVARSRPPDRMGLVSARALKAGEPISTATVRFAMALPDDAIPVERWGDVEGVRVVKDVAAMCPIRWEDVARGR